MKIICSRCKNFHYCINSFTRNRKTIQTERIIKLNLYKNTNQRAKVVRKLVEGDFVILKHLISFSDDICIRILTNTRTKWPIVPKDNNGNGIIRGKSCRTIGKVYDGHSRRLYDACNDRNLAAGHFIIGHRLMVSEVSGE